MKLDIEREREYLSTKAKEIWNMTKESVLVVAKEENLTKEQTECLLQLQMAKLRYNDLAVENQYNARTNEKNSQNKIKLNNIKMREMQRVYGDQEKELKGVRVDKLNQKIENKRNEKIIKANTKKQ